MKKIIIIFLGIFLISLTSAMYPGECSNINFPNEDSVNMTLSNSSIEGFSWSKNKTIITYCLSVDFIPQTFSIEWYNTESIIIDIPPQQSGGGGGSSSSKVKKIEGWVCGEWSECIEGVETRDCELNGKISKKFKWCVEEIDIETDDEIKDDEIIEEESDWNYLIVMVIILILIFIFFRVYEYKKK